MVLAGGELAISARVVGRATLDPDKHLQFEKRSIVEQDFSGLELDSFCSISSKFMRCAFRNIHIADASFGEGLKQSLYRDCIFDGARFGALAPGTARFENCSFRGVSIHEMFANRVELVNCVFSGRLKKGVLSARRPPEFRRWWERSRNRIVNNDFSAMEFGDFGSSVASISLGRYFRGHQTSRYCGMEQSLFGEPVNASRDGRRTRPRGWPS